LFNATVSLAADPGFNPIFLNSDSLNGDSPLVLDDTIF
jgi:hypothetical protein